MNIRRFEETDKKDFLLMCKDFYTCGATIGEISEIQMKNTFNYILSDGTHLNGFIIEHDGETAGYGLVILFYSNEVGGLCGLLDEIYILPQFRGEGLGSSYLDEIASALNEDIIGLRLEACYSNERALKLYEDMGFKTLNYKQLVKIM